MNTTAIPVDLKEIVPGPLTFRDHGREVTVKYTSRVFMADRRKESTEIDFPERRKSK